MQQHQSGVQHRYQVHKRNPDGIGVYNHTGPRQPGSGCNIKLRLGFLRGYRTYDQSYPAAYPQR